MRPEKVERRDKPEAYAAVGVAPEWVAPLQKAGVLTVDALAEVASAGKLHQELCGLNKKFKLELKNPTADEVAAWIAAAAAAKQQ